MSDPAQVQASIPARALADLLDVNGADADVEFLAVAYPEGSCEFNIRSGGRWVPVELVGGRCGER